MIETEYLPPGHPPVHDIELDIDALKAQWAARRRGIRRSRSAGTSRKPSHRHERGVDVKRISVDIGGTFTDCFVAWEDRYIQARR